MDPMWFSSGSFVVYPMLPYLVVPHGPLTVSPVIPQWFPQLFPIDSLAVPYRFPYWSLMIPELFPSRSLVDP